MFAAPMNSLSESERERPADEESQEVLRDEDSLDEGPDVKFYPSCFEEVEDLERYEPDGFHPVHLGDLYNSGQYRIIHKLGFGGFSTVWLARDNHSDSIVALKIVAADSSNDYKDLKTLQELAGNSSGPIILDHFPSLLNHFWLDGPNGRHLCLVLSVLGSSISQMSGTDRRLHPEVSRRAALQTTQGLSCMHTQGICHGDLTGANILFGLSSKFAYLSDEEVYDQLGKPGTDVLKRISGEHTAPSAPSYVVKTPDISNIDPTMMEDKICIIDFDQSFHILDPPTTMLGTPSKYLAPEAIFELHASSSSDVWALGCAIFRMRAGYDLFEVWGTGSPSDSIGEMINTIGELPEKWRHTRFDDDGVPIRKTDSQSEQNGVELSFFPKERSLMKRIMSISDEAKPSPTTDLQRDKIFWNPLWFHDGNSPPIEEGDSLDREENEEKDDEDDYTGLLKISLEEATSLHDLLSRILVYDPMQRPSTEEILQHPWFTTAFYRRRIDGSRLD